MFHTFLCLAWCWCHQWHGCLQILSEICSGGKPFWKYKRETLHHCIFSYFQSKSFDFMSYFSLDFGQRLWLVFDFHYSTWWIQINVDQVIPLKARRNFCRCNHWKQQTQLCLHVSGKILWSCPLFLVIWKKESKFQYLLTIMDNFYRVTDKLLTN